MSKVYVTPKVKTETAELGVFGCYGGMGYQRPGSYQQPKKGWFWWWRWW